MPCQGSWGGPPGDGARPDGAAARVGGPSSVAYRRASGGAAAALLQVEVGVRTGQNVVQGVPGAGGRDPARRGERVRGVQLLQDLVGPRLVGGRQTQDELVAAVAAEQVGLPQPGG